MAEKSSNISDLLLFMEQSTPKKVHPQKFSLPALPQCIQEPALASCFRRAGKAGSDKNLALKNLNVCGI